MWSDIKTETYFNPTEYMSQLLNNYKQMGSLLNILWHNHEVLKLKPFLTSEYKMKKKLIHSKHILTCGGILYGILCVR
jgi:hypothetical protein